MIQRGHCRKSTDRGFALLFVIFLVALVLIGASVAILRIKTQGLRQREADMIWRGEQYQRAIGLYYRKNGRYPTSIDDLVKGTPGLRYLREPYKDPMNRADGSWRLIYVTPAGQLIGSVRYVTLQEMALADRARIMGIQMGQSTGSDSGQISGDQSQDQTSNPGANPNSSPAPPGAQPPAGTGNGASPSSSPPAPGGDQSAQQPNGSPQPAPPQPAPFGVMQQSLPPGAQPQINESTGEVVGGFIVGVASKIDKPSLKVYKGGATYKQWEFIYNPLEQVQTIGGGSMMGGTPAGAQPPLPGMPQMPQIPKPPQPQSPLGPGGTRR
ncbi:MAG TPA: hypothetical protein VJN21_12370 [Candidatus Acidoferrales bacterium]|nr:hypothetical protein [Candidatus Acidoferrales bacterium]